MNPDSHASTTTKEKNSSSITNKKRKKNRNKRLGFRNELNETHKLYSDDESVLALHTQKFGVKSN